MYLGENPEINDDQKRIWYIEFIDCWITTDNTNRLIFWDLGSEKPYKLLDSKYFEKGIINLVEIGYLKAGAVAS